MNNLNDTLPELMRRATENLEPESTDLVERGMRRGTVLRRRRTALLSFTGAGAVLATAGIVIGGTQLFGGSAEPPAAGTAGQSVTEEAATPVTQKETLATLMKLLPANLKVSKPQTWGDNGFHGAAVVVDDGQGPSKISLGVTAPGADGTCTMDPGTCKTRPDGSLISVQAGEPTYGEGNPGGVIRNSVTVVRPGTGSISLISFNAAEEKGVDKSRAMPALSLEQLITIADSQTWRFPLQQKVPTSGPTKPEPKSPGAGKPAVPVQQTLLTLKKVLPRDLTFTRPETWGGGTEGFNGAAYVINDGKGASRIDVSVSYEQPVTKCGPEGIAHCQVRSDGAVVGWTKDEPTYSDARQKVNGVLANRVEIHYPNGRTIGMTSYNGPQEKDAKHTRAKPAFTPDELMAMANNRGWKFPGTGTK